MNGEAERLEEASRLKSEVWEQPYAEKRGVVVDPKDLRAVLSELSRLQQQDWRPICEYEIAMGPVETFGCLHDVATAFGERPSVQISRLTKHGFVSDELGSHEPVFFRLPVSVVHGDHDDKASENASLRPALHGASTEGEGE